MFATIFLLKLPTTTSILRRISVCAVFTVEKLGNTRC